MSIMAFCYSVLMGGSMHDQGLHRDSWWWSQASTQRYTYHSKIHRIPVLFSRCHLTNKAAAPPCGRSGGMTLLMCCME